MAISIVLSVIITGLATRSIVYCYKRRGSAPKIAKRNILLAIFIAILMLALIWGLYAHKHGGLFKKTEAAPEEITAAVEEPADATTVTEENAEAEHQPQEIVGQAFTSQEDADLSNEAYLAELFYKADPDGGDYYLLLAHMCAVGERFGVYQFASLEGKWKVQDGSKFANSENELADILKDNYDLRKEVYEELVSLNLTARGISGTYNILDEVRNGRAVWLGETTKGEFVEVIYKDKLGKEHIFARFLKSCGNAAEKIATTSTNITYYFGVTYVMYGGSNGPSNWSTTDTTNVAKTVALSSTVPTRDGYSFGGWSTVDGGKNAVTAVTVSPNTVTVVYSIWIPDAIIHYDSNGGAAISDKVVKFTTWNGVPVNFETPTKKGYSFKGWTLNGSIISGLTVQPGDVVTLVAAWKAESSGSSSGSGHHKGGGSCSVGSDPTTSFPEEQGTDPGEDAGEKTSPGQQLTPKDISGEEF